MADSKPEMTWADYLAVAVAPVLIIVLVGSLCFFLLDIGYAGQFAARLRWILFCFVFGSVMLARVSITQGVAHAGLLGLGLGGATALAIAAFVNQPIIGCLLVGVVWWCAHKLTWNCTFIDDTVDPSAAGLLETAGQDERLADRRIGKRSEAERVRDRLSDETFRAEEALRLKQAPWWKRAWHSITDLEPKSHAPGLSVLYFSLAALPLFGFGQWFIPAGASDRQSSAFRWLTLYLASGLGLLLVTSFLGLRRYLRRRNLEMPAAMTSAWMGVGVVMIVALLLGALVLPLPSARNDWAVALRDRVLTSPDRETSKTAPLKTDGTQSDDRDASRTSDGKPPEGGENPPADSGQQGASSDTQSDQGDANPREGESQSGDQEGSQDESSDSRQTSGGDSGDKDAPAEKQGQSQSSKTGTSPTNDGNSSQQSPSGTSGNKSSTRQGNQGGSTSTPPPPAHPPSTPPNPLPSLGWLRPLLWVALAIAALIAAIVYRERIFALLREIAEIWRGLWNVIFPRKTRAELVEPPAAKPAFRPFADFANPFTDGRARRASADELVKYTFAALEAWAYEQGAGHRAEETPLEFTSRITAMFVELGTDATRVGGWLARSLYAREVPPRESLATLESLWRAMQSGLAAHAR